MSDKSWEPGMYECLNVLNNFCFHVYAQNLLSHFLTLTLSHSHSFSLSHSFNLSFNHSRHAEQVLFSSLCSKVAVYRRKLQCFFLDLILLVTLTCYFRVHRAGSQLKIKSKGLFRLCRVKKYVLGNNVPSCGRCLQTPGMTGLRPKMPYS